MASRRADLALARVKSEESELLAEVGARVRAWRARRGMTRNQLASQSGLSLRFLLDVEAGRGNLSLNSLERIARGLNIRVLELMDDAPRPSLARVVSLLDGLDDSALERAYAYVWESFENMEAPGRQSRIALVGLRGAGKSTLGALLAEQRGLPFVELDKVIERLAGTSISEILLLHGQADYRRYELRALIQVYEENKAGVVLSTGGSIVSEKETLETLQRFFYCVWLKARPEEHMLRVIAQGDVRPFESGTLRELHDPASKAGSRALDDIRRILDSRESLYALSDAVVDTSSRTVKQSLSDLDRAVPKAVR